MNTQVDAPVKAFTAGEALEAWRRVKKSGDNVIYADAGERSIGVTQRAVSNGDPVPVKMWTSDGTFKIESAGAITANAAVYGADDGKIDDAVSGPQEGTANEAATASGNLIEVLPVKVPSATIADPAASADDIVDSSGGTAAANHTIPAATNTDDLTDNGGGAADGTVEDVADVALSTSNTYTDDAVNTAINAAIASVSNNFKEMTTQLAKQRALNTLLLNAVATISAEYNKLKDDVEANNSAIDAQLLAAEKAGVQLGA